MCKCPRGTFWMYQHCRIGFKNQYSSVRHNREIDSRIIKIHSFADGLNGLHASRTKNRFRMLQKLFFFLLLPGTGLHLSSVIVHHPVLRYRQVIWVGFAVDKNHPILAEAGIGGTEINKAGNIHGTGLLGFALRKFGRGGCQHQADTALSMYRSNQQRQLIYNSLVPVIAIGLPPDRRNKQVVYPIQQKLAAYGGPCVQLCPDD